MIDVEQGTFTPLVFGTNGGFGKECDLFIKKLAEKMALKSDESYPVLSHGFELSCLIAF